MTAVPGPTRPSGDRQPIEATGRTIFSSVLLTQTDLYYYDQLFVLGALDLRIHPVLPARWFQLPWGEHVDPTLCGTSPLYTIIYLATSYQLLYDLWPLASTDGPQLVATVGAYLTCPLQLEKVT